MCVHLIFEIGGMLTLLILQYNVLIPRFMDTRLAMFFKENQRALHRCMLAGRGVEYKGTCKRWQYEYLVI